MTPEEAIALEPGTTPGPWEHDDVPGPGEDPTRATEVYLQDESGAIAYVQPNAADVALIAAAPDMLATIAALRWEYAVENSDGDFLDLNDDAYSGVEVLWTWHRTVAEEVQAACGGTLVRCLGGPMEVVE